MFIGHPSCSAISAFSAMRRPLYAVVAEQRACCRYDVPLRARRGSPGPVPAPSHVNPKGHRPLFGLRAHHDGRGIKRSSSIRLDCIIRNIPTNEKWSFTANLIWDNMLGFLHAHDSANGIGKERGATVHLAPKNEIDIQREMSMLEVKERRDA